MEQVEDVEFEEVQEVDEVAEEYDKLPKETRESIDRIQGKKRSMSHLKQAPIYWARPWVEDMQFTSGKKCFWESVLAS